MVKYWADLNNTNDGHDDNDSAQRKYDDQGKFLLLGDLEFPERMQRQYQDFPKGLTFDIGMKGGFLLSMSLATSTAVER